MDRKCEIEKLGENEIFLDLVMLIGIEWNVKGEGVEWKRRGRMTNRGFNGVIKMLMIGAHEGFTFKSAEIRKMWMKREVGNERTIKNNFVH
jgi:hypothetical protein